MRVFLTGATGFIGSALIPELLRHGHQVLGLARSDDGARALRALGAEALRGDLEDQAALRRGAGQADGVVHCGFIHDFTKFAENCAIDRRAIETFGEVLAGSTRPLVVTAGIPALPGKVTTEADAVPTDHPMPRVSEQAALALAERGVHAAVVRLPQVHDRDKSGLIPYFIAVARQKGVSAYVDEGLNRFAAAHRLSTPSLYRLALEKGTAGSRFHAVEEEGITMKAIAEAIGRGLKVPVISVPAGEAMAHFGTMGHFATLSNPASSALTRQRLGWNPGTHPGLIDDLDHSTAYAA
ncbi:SDR family oxidoreductase [Scleromatobacter humisilvae]|uniref:SDR family oxidoreductase n=1 Tax=Scleromatobacter humisilvae TaxID=2897159 RepID=A0A9X2C3S4_9BURK|nr:SDR family oxidoreductase [Scleromatobacter humisilvae]MCK9688699.1 SDR family oxidoreductase [Scleromatobacter humisilvae]